MEFIAHVTPEWIQCAEVNAHSLPG
jgi:hypothetical protein